jgi:hypothetical protein
LAERLLTAWLTRSPKLPAALVAPVLGKLCPAVFEAEATLEEPVLCCVSD